MRHRQCPITAYYYTVGRLPTGHFGLPEGCVHWACVQRVRKEKSLLVTLTNHAYLIARNQTFSLSPKAGYDKVINENAVPHLFIPGLVSLIRPRS